MNKTVTSILGIAIAVALVLGIVGVNKSGKVGPEGAVGPQGPQGERGLAGSSGSAGVPGKDAPVRLGATPTLDGVDNPNVRINGLREYYYSQAIAASSSVLCAFKVTATSTLLEYGIFAKTNTMNTTLDVSTSSSAFFAAGSYGTSSPAYVRGFATPNALGFSMVWAGNGTTTSTKLIGTTVSANVGNSDNLIFPGQYITAVTASTSAGVFVSGYAAGTCSAKLLQL